MPVNEQSTLQVLVIGGGPSGVSAAAHAAELGAKVTLIEQGKVGGTVRNAGPAPVRTLARAARLIRDANSWETFGIRGERPDVDLGAAIANAVRVASYAEEEKHLASHLRTLGIDLIEDAGLVSFVGTHTVRAEDGREWSADRIIVAVGGHAGRLTIPGAELGLTYADVASVPALPERVCVIGASDTGCQLASILTDFGAAVTLIEWAPRIIPAADVEVSEGVTAGFESRGLTIIAGAAVTELEETASGVRVRFDKDGEAGFVEADAAFFAIGWPGNADSLGAAEFGITTGRGYLVTAPTLQTSLPHVYAVGDITGQNLLVSSGEYEGRLAAHNAVTGASEELDYRVVPTGSFTGPEYGRVGLGETQARELYDVVVETARYDDLLRPVADAKPDGFCKLIVDRDTQTIVGAHVLGDYSAEVIQTVAAFMVGNVTIDQVADMQYAFPTYTEAVGLAAQKVVRALGTKPVAPLWRY